MDSIRRAEPDDAASGNYAASILTTFNSGQEGSTEPVNTSLHETPQVQSTTPNTSLSWQEDPTNPVNKPPQPTTQSLSNTQSQWAVENGLDRDDPTITPIRHSLELRRARIAAIESLPDMTLKEKLHLRDMLGYDDWPTRFQTHENFHAPMFHGEEQSAAAWSEADERALKLITLHGPHDLAVVASVFFPERPAMDVFTKVEGLFGRGGVQELENDDGQASSEAESSGQETSLPTTWFGLN